MWDENQIRGHGIKSCRFRFFQWQWLGLSWHQSITKATLRRVVYWESWLPCMWHHWQIQLASYDFARKWIKGHYICMWKLWTKRCFATRKNKTPPCVWESSQWPLLHAWTLAEQTFMARDLVFGSQGKHTFEGKVSDSKMLKVLEAWLKVPAIGINSKQ